MVMIAVMARDPVATGLRIAKRRQMLNRANVLRLPSEPMMRQEDLAARLGVAPSTVANWERGKSYPVRYLGALEAVLGVSLTDEEPQPELELELDENELVILGFKNLPPGAPQKLFEFYRELTGRSSTNGTRRSARTR